MNNINKKAKQTRNRGVSILKPYHCKGCKKDYLLYKTGPCYNCHDRKFEYGFHYNDINKDNLHKLYGYRKQILIPDIEDAYRRCINISEHQLIDKVWKYIRSNHHLEADNIERIFIVADKPTYTSVRIILNIYGNLNYVFLYDLMQRFDFMNVDIRIPMQDKVQLWFHFKPKFMYVQKDTWNEIMRNE